VDDPTDATRVASSLAHISPLIKIGEQSLFLSLSCSSQKCTTMHLNDFGADSDSSHCDFYWRTMNPKYKDTSEYSGIFPIFESKI